MREREYVGRGRRGGGEGNPMGKKEEERGVG